MFIYFVSAWILGGWGPRVGFVAFDGDRFCEDDTRRNVQKLFEPRQNVLCLFVSPSVSAQKAYKSCFATSYTFLINQDEFTGGCFSLEYTPFVYTVCLFIYSAAIIFIYRVA